MKALAGEEKGEGRGLLGGNFEGLGFVVRCNRKEGLILCLV